MIKHKMTLSTALLLSIPSLTLAAPSSLGNIIITATRTPQTADETFAPVTVITQEMIEKQQVKSMRELLQGLPGVTISSNGGIGKFSSVLLRGTEADHALVLVDGIKIGSATFGGAALQDIPVSQIERIEIVRGPRASLYGSEAIGGVIQIFTRKGGGDLKQAYSVSAGSHGTYETSGSLSGGGAHGWFHVGLDHLSTQGFNSCRGDPMGGGCWTDEPDKDGYHTLSGSARGGYRFDNGVDVDFQWLKANSDNHYDSSYTNESESSLQTLGGKIQFSPQSFWHLSLLGGRSWDRADDFKDGLFLSRFNTRRDTLSLQNDFSLPRDQLVSLGLDYQKDHIESLENYAVTSRDNRGVFAQYQGKWSPHHDVQVSLRRDDNDQFGGKTTGGASWRYTLGKSLWLTSSYGTAFKAPAFNELYYPFFGNPNLLPEKSRSAEVGLSGWSEWGEWSANLYQTEIDDLIAYDASTYLPGNIQSARIRGLEGSALIRLAEWDVRPTLNLLDPENRSAPYAGNTLPRRAKKSFRIDADREIQRYRFGATLNMQGERYDDLANTQLLDVYYTLDIRLEYTLNKSWTLQGRVANLFDRQYEMAAFYPQPGREFFLTLRYQP